jgi:4-hydroxymandelate oxidase
MAFHALVCKEGECATAQASNDVGSLMIAATFANRSLEEIVAVAPGPLWFQLYVFRNLALTESLLRRAEAAGYGAIVLTVDTPFLGRRERDIRNNFTLPAGLRIANFDDDAQPDHYIPSPSVITWRTVEWLRNRTKLPLILKGILRVDDALLAVENGVDGVIVSNHGGRQLDGAMASIDALPAIAKAVANRCEIYVDGGIRRGTHILKALALGARAVLVGRPIIWGLAADGAEGVRHVSNLLHEELRNAMALAGCSSLADIDSSLVCRSWREDGSADYGLA